MDSTGNLRIGLSDGRVAGPFLVKGPNGEPGATGATGTPGVGIKNTSIDTSGQLVIELTNGTFLQPLKVKGETGAAGIPGVGIKQSRIVDDKLFLDYTDNTSSIGFNVRGPQGLKGDPGTSGTNGSNGLPGPTGPPGPSGVGIARTSFNTSGQLIITLTNNNSLQALDVKGPKGDKGDKGDEGPAGVAATLQNVNSITLPEGWKIDVSSGQIRFIKDGTPTVNISKNSLSIGSWRIFEENGELIISKNGAVLGVNNSPRFAFGTGGDFLMNKYEPKWIGNVLRHIKNDGNATTSFGINGNPGHIFHGGHLSSMYNKTQNLNEDGSTTSAFKINGNNGDYFTTDTLSDMYRNSSNAVRKDRWYGIDNKDGRRLQMTGNYAAATDSGNFGNWEAVRLVQGELKFPRSYLNFFIKDVFYKKNGLLFVNF